MRVNLLGFQHDRSSDHLVRAFLPMSRVDLDEEEGADADITCRYTQQDGKWAMDISIQAQGEPPVEVHREEAVTADEKQLKNMTKRTLYQALAKLTGRQLPWGILVGVRPTKLLREMEQQGHPLDEMQHILEGDFFVRTDKAELALATYRNERHVLEGALPEGISVYVGIPFCPSRCYYCSFVSSSIEAMRRYIPDYLRCLCEEIRRKGEILKRSGKVLQSVYMGGGTPTSLDASQMRRVLQAMREHLDFSQVKEYTVECGRPDTITREKLELLQEFGVTRISINPQSMNNATLERIGRRHTAEEICDAFHMAREMGFTDINMDLIAGLEGEEPEDFRCTVEGVLALGPENITVHTLCLKKGSDLSNEGKFRTDRGAVVEQMLDIGYHALKGVGYTPYYMYRQKNMTGNFENVSYCKDGAFGFYNVAIMQEYQSICAMGAGSVTKLVSPGKIVRLANPKYPYEYIARFEEFADRLPL